MHKDLFWSLDGDYVYLDNAASAPPFKEVVYAAMDFLKTYGSIHRGSGRLSEMSTAAYEDARKTIAKFIGAKQERDAVIFRPNTTDAINRLSLIKQWRAVLVSDIEHSSNYLPWERKTEVFTFASDDTSLYPRGLRSLVPSVPCHNRGKRSIGKGVQIQRRTHGLMGKGDNSGASPRRIQAPYRRRVFPARRRLLDEVKSFGMQPVGFREYIHRTAGARGIEKEEAEEIVSRLYLMCVVSSSDPAAVYSSAVQRRL